MVLAQPRGGVLGTRVSQAGSLLLQAARLGPACSYTQTCRDPLCSRPQKRQACWAPVSLRPSPCVLAANVLAGSSKHVSRCWVLKCPPPCHLPMFWTPPTYDPVTPPTRTPEPTLLLSPSQHPLLPLCLSSSCEPWRTKVAPVPAWDPAAWQRPAGCHTHGQWPLAPWLACPVGESEQPCLSLHHSCQALAGLRQAHRPPCVSPAVSQPLALTFAPSANHVGSSSSIRTCPPLLIPFAEPTG